MKANCKNKEKKGVKFGNKNGKKRESLLNRQEKEGKVNLN